MWSNSKNLFSWTKAAVILSVAYFHSQVTFRTFACASSVVNDEKIKGHMTESKKKKMGGCNAKPEKFPDSLEGFGYKFNKRGQLRDIDTGQPFKFEVEQDDWHYNQRHYEALGEVITKKVYELLENDAGLEKVDVPVDAKNSEGKGFFFKSQDAQDNDKLMILIHGSGVVRAGQWTRKLIINDDLDSGTMLPYISRAQKKGFAVLIPNGNHNFDSSNGSRIRGSETPDEHFKYIWENFIKSAKAKTIVIVAHSYGGVVTVESLKVSDGFMDRVKAVAFTDSVHSLGHQGVTKEQREWMIKHSRNWVSSDLPLDTPLGPGYGCERVSAGTPRHEVTSHAAFESVFKFFEEKLGDINETGEGGEPVDTDEPMDVENSEKGGKEKQMGTDEEAMQLDEKKEETSQAEKKDEEDKDAKKKDETTKTEDGKTGDNKELGNKQEKTVKEEEGERKDKERVGTEGDAKTKTKQPHGAKSDPLKSDL